MQNYGALVKMHMTTLLHLLALQLVGDMLWWRYAKTSMHYDTIFVACSLIITLKSHMMVHKKIHDSYVIVTPFSLSFDRLVDGRKKGQ
jgi:Na+/H+ antiporter NhaA